MLQFVREIPIRIVIEGASSARRGFLFYLAAGFFKEIDPLSGMSVDLVLVDQWLASLKKDLEQTVFITPGDAVVRESFSNEASLRESSIWGGSSNKSAESFSHSFAEIMSVSRLNLIEKAEKYGASLKSLRFREERGWSFSWDSAQSPEEMVFSCSLYLESFLKSEGIEDSEDQCFDLLKATFNWVRHQGCEDDFYRESLKLLKTCSFKTTKDFHKKMGYILGARLSSGSFLVSIEVSHLGEDFVTTF